MRITDAHQHLLAMLSREGIEPGVVPTVDIGKIVEVFRRFAAVPVADARPDAEDGDGVLAQFGTYDFRGRREFSVDLTRQFFVAGDEDSPPTQLSCTLHWEPSPETDALGAGSQWSFGSPLGEFFDEAAALPGWAWASSAAPRTAYLTVVQD